MRKQLTALLAAALLFAGSTVLVAQQGPTFNTPSKNTNVANITGTLPANKGGTGVSNAAASTITLAGPLATTGAFTTTFAAGGTATHTLPSTSGTVCSSAAQCAATSFAPSTTSGIIGTATNNSAAAGSVGEYIEATGTVTALTASPTNVTSISLTAGDWDVTGGFTNAGVSTQNNVRVGITQTTGSFTGTVAGQSDIQFATNVTGGVVGGTIANVRTLLSGTTTIYLIAQPGTANLANFNGALSARRRR